MKTLERNKCGLECIRTNVERVCVKPEKGQCPRCKQHADEAMEFIQQLESNYSQASKALCGKENATLEDVLLAVNQVKAELAAVKRERDAAVKDLKSACKLLWNEYMQCCKFCEHENEPKDTGYCDKCANGNRFKFKPAALCPENTEVQEDA